ncbi:MAG: ABC transporter permease [Oscillospiraceae bacterium]|nr:ABC transporter permease [Oscillospiraceae bacterium]
MKVFIKNVFKYRYLLEDLTTRDLKVKYRRSLLGILWSVLNPLLMMMVITAVFSSIFKVVENFPIYYLTGSLIFNFFGEATNGALTSILGNSPLIKKVYVPKFIFPLEKTIFAFVNMLFSLLAVIIMFIILRFVPSWTIVFSPFVFLYVLVFSLGVGFFLSAISIFFRDVIHLYSVFLTALMYMTPIIYPESMLESMPAIVSNVIYCNPMYYYVQYFRNVAMYGIVPSLKDNLICIFCALLSLLIGSLVLKKSQNKFILYI